MKKFLLIPTAVLVLTVAHKQTIAQTYPTFGNKIPVTINGLTFDALEPSISADGNYLFFNSAYNGNSDLHYATKVNDSTFTYVGPLTGANQSGVEDLVSSSDSANNFFWVSYRYFPSQYENYFRGTFNGTNVVNIGRVHGNFYINSPGWALMDAAINYDGSKLYYANNFLNTNYQGCSGMPCIALLGVAQKVNDSTFSKLSNSDGIMQNINDTNYLCYAPFISKDGLELYYTRLLKTNPQSEICVSVRSAITDTFSLPSIIYTSAFIPEAPTLTTDQSKMYHHEKVGSLFKIFLRYRTSANGINELSSTNGATIYPNPFSTQTVLQTNNPLHNATLTVDNCFGQTVAQIKNINGQTITFHRDNLASGLYFVRLTQDSKVIATKKLLITD